MLVVLDGRSLTEVVSPELSQLRQTIVEICDSIVVTDLILQEYANTTAWSNLQPQFETFKEENPSKLTPRNASPVENIPRHNHWRLVEGYLGTSADYLILHDRWWTSRAGRYHLHIVTSNQYIDERPALK